MITLSRRLAASFRAAHSAVMVGAAALALGAVTTGQASAQGAVNCGSTALTVPYPTTLNNPVTFNVTTGDRIELAGGLSAPGGLGAVISKRDGAEFSAQLPYTYSKANNQFGTGTVEVRGQHPTSSTFVRCIKGNVNPPNEEETSLPTAATVSASLQTSTIQTAINTNIAGRFGMGSGFAASSNGLFVSTRGLDAAADSLGEPELNAWVSGEARRFTGGHSGQNASLTLGLDHLVTSDFLLGGYVGMGTQSLTAAGNTTDTQSPVLGAYAARRFGDDMFVSGFVGIARPDYQVGNDSAAGERVMAGLSLTGELELGVVRLQPSAGVLTSTENLPALGASAADTLANLQGKLAVRVEPMARFENGMLPYLSLAAEVNKLSSNAGEESFVKPRLGLGGDMALGKGTLRFDLDYGFVAQDTNDLGAKLTYNFAF